MKIFKQFRRSLGTGRQIADQEHGPLVSNQLECTGYWATINLASSHNSPARNSKTSATKIRVLPEFFQRSFVEMVMKACASSKK
jgi:hypothetical protein